MEGKAKITKILVILGTLAVFLVACATRSAEEAKIRATWDRNVDYASACDVPGYMSTIASSSPARISTEISIQTLCLFYRNLKYTTEQFKVLSLEDERAVVRIVLVTRAEPASPLFMDNRVTADSIFVKEDGEWKIYDTQVVNIEYLS